MKPKVAVFMQKVECKKYPNSVWNFITREKKMQVYKLCKQQGIKPTTKKTITDAKIAALEAKLRITSQPKEVMSRRRKGRLPKNQHGG